MMNTLISEKYTRKELAEKFGFEGAGKEYQKEVNALLREKKESR